MTRVQAAALAFIRQYLNDHGLAPTLAEIGLALGFSAPRAYNIIDQLIAINKLVRVRPRGTSRSIALFGDGLGGFSDAEIQAEYLRRKLHEGAVA